MRGEKCIQYISKIDGGTLTMQTTQYIIKKLYKMLPNAFKQINKLYADNITDNIKLQVLKHFNAMIWWVKCCVLNISGNKQQQLMKQMNYQYDHQFEFEQNCLVFFFFCCNV